MTNSPLPWINPKRTLKAFLKNIYKPFESISKNCNEKTTKGSHNEYFIHYIDK